MFLGILPKMSVILRDDKGYDKSFYYPPSNINILPTCQVEVKDYPGWADNYSSFRRIVQISDAFHPESANNKLEDKCNQIRYSIQKLIPPACCKEVFCSLKGIIFW